MTKKTGKTGSSFQ